MPRVERGAGAERVAEEIRRRAEREAESTTELLSALVQIPSPTGEEERIVNHLGELLTEAGFDQVRVDGLGNLIGRIGGGPGTLAVDAHIDTVGPGERDQWDCDPFCGDVEDGWLLGRGSVDQKGGAAAMVTAGRILKSLSYDGRYTVWFTFTIMEEDCDGLCWKYLIEEEKLVPDYAVITEPTNMGVYRGQRGRMEMDVSFRGVSAHGSAPERGDNAVYKAARGALAVEELHERLTGGKPGAQVPGGDPFLGRGSVAVTQIGSSGPSLCAVPDAAAFHLDRRLTWGETPESALEEVRSALGEGAGVDVPVYDRPSYRGTRYPQEMVFPTWKTEEDHPLVSAGAETYRRLYGDPARLGKWTFSTNGVAICGRAGIPTVGFGPGDETFAHAPNERTAVSDLVRAPAFYALLPYVLGERAP